MSKKWSYRTVRILDHTGKWNNVYEIRERRGKNGDLLEGPYVLDEDGEWWLYPEKGRFPVVTKREPFD